MTPERWQQMKELLDDALGLPPSERTAWLVRTCGDDEDLRQKLDAYLAFDPRSTDFMETPALSLLAREPETLEPGQGIGPYKVARRIGRGGAGTVYLAVREHSFTKEVAIKVLERGTNTGEIVRRFEQERQILAQLEHPGIARLLDGGSTDDGLPYFVMELIEGERIDHYCAHHELSVDERLELFRRVSSAVAFAHRNLVVHRDLKPSNILVTTTGEPKLLDFGIAKLLDPESPSLEELDSGEHPRPMTLAYASPEQVLGRTVTTASDVFALGILLWELLTGRRPYTSRSASELARAICREELPAPSTLRRHLRGDLDHIVRKALAKKPEERYSSVEQLSQDIERHMTHSPVLARPGTLAYRGRRFLRRHWVPLGVAALFFLVVLGFGIHARVRSIELDESLRVSEEIAGLLGDVFAASDPYSPEPPAVERLDRGVAEIRRQLAAQPEIEVELLESIALAYGGLGEYRKAVDLLREIVHLREAHWGRVHPGVAESRVNLSSALQRLDKSGEAEVVLSEGLAILKELHGENHPDVFSSEHNLAVLWSRHQRGDEAEKLFRSLLERREEYGDELGAATEMNSLGVRLYKQGELAEAEQLFQEALDRRERLLGAAHPAVATVLGNYGMLLRKDEERRGASEEMLTRALDILSRELPADHRDVAAGHYRLALLFNDQWKMGEAEHHYRETVTRARRGLSPGHSDLATFLLGAAAFLARQGSFIDAEALAREAVDNLDVAGKAKPSRLAEARSVLGACLAGQERFAPAEELLLDSYAVLKQGRGPAARRTREALGRIVRLYELWGKPAKEAEYRALGPDAAALDAQGARAGDRGELKAAEKYYREAVEIRRTSAPGSLELAASLAHLGWLAADFGKLDTAQRHFREALGIQEKLAPKSLAHAGSLRGLALVARYRKDFGAALELSEEAYAIARSIKPKSIEVAEILNDIGRLEGRTGGEESEEIFYQKSLAMNEQLNPESLSTAKTLHNLGNMAHRRAEFDRSEAYHLRSLAIREKLAPRSLDLARSLNMLALVELGRGDFETAGRYYWRALGIAEELAPKSPAVGSILNNLGIVAVARSDLLLAEDCYLRALEIERRLNPSSHAFADRLVALGQIAMWRGDLAAATAYVEQGFELFDPGSYNMINALEVLGPLSRVTGNLELADKYYDQIAEHRQRMNSYELLSLGHLAHIRGDLEAAEDLMQDAHRTSLESSTFGSTTNRALAALGELARKRGDLEAATRYYRRALGPETFGEAPTGDQGGETLWIWHGLGTTYRESGETRPAAEAFTRAVELLERQTGRVGGSHEIKARYRASRHIIYQDAVAGQMELGNPAAAFHLVERSRAQSALAMLAERNLVLTTDPDLDEKLRRNKTLYDSTLKKRETLPGDAGPAEVAALKGQLTALRAERDSLRLEISKVSPGAAAVRYPRARHWQEVREVLDPGTVMLAYHVGARETYLFVVRPGKTLRVLTIPLGHGELRDEVRESREDFDGAASRRRRERLYQALVEPVETDLAEAGRILLVPDGPLHLLPFAALIRGTGARAHYLVEWKPLHIALSATIYAELRESRPPAPVNSGDGPWQLVAFGDPVYPEEVAVNDDGQVLDLRLRSALHRGDFDWSRLPSTRREVEEIARLFGAAGAELFLGEDATEERIKALAAFDHGIIHFATHGYVDERSALDSALVLTIPEGLPEERDNGLLQVWEILESVRFDADLVVLSACETGTGELRGGEGLISLTRAFQVAGARSVLATLWSVADDATAELMIRFYRHLHSGLTKDEALRAAQLELIHAPLVFTTADGRRVKMDASSPYFWAGFELVGDWQ